MSRNDINQDAEKQARGQNTRYVGHMGTGINSQQPGEYNEQDMDSNSRGAEKGAYETHEGANLFSKNLQI